MHAARSQALFLALAPTLLSACVFDWSEKQGYDASFDPSALPDGDAGDPAHTDGGAASEQDAQVTSEGCAPGFARTSAGEPCADIDECASDHGGCDPNAACVPSMTPGAAPTCSCLPPFTGPGDSCTSPVPALETPPASSLHDLPSPVAIHAAATGLSSSAYSVEWQRLTALHYYPVTLSTSVLPDGTLSYSSVFHKDASVAEFLYERDLTDAEYSAKWAAYRDSDYRPIEVVAHDTPNGLRFGGVWVPQEPGTGWSSFRNLTLAGLQEKLAEMNGRGYRPIRVHGYTANGSTLYSAVWVGDALGTDYRIVLEADATVSVSEFTKNVEDGYWPLDMSIYPVGSENRYSTIYVRDPSLTGYAAFADLTLGEYQAKQQEYAEANYVQVDAEHYSRDPSALAPAYAGVWLQRANAELVSSLNVDDLASWPAGAREAYKRIRSTLNGYAGSVGFVVEDLTNGQYLGFRMHEPFYLASTAKVLIAAHVMARVDAGELSLDQKLRFELSDLLEEGDAPGPGDCSLSAPACGEWTLEQTLRWMLNESSTNATDRLVRLLGAAELNDFLFERKIVDVGEVTSICEVDRRAYLAQSSCVKSLDCLDLVRWNRDGALPDSQTERDCVAQLDKQDDASYERYYASLANSMTPLQYARFWRRVLDTDMLSAASRNALIQGVLAETPEGWMSGAVGKFYTVQAGKFGGQHETDSYVAIGYGNVESDPPDARPEFSLALFTEDQPADTVANEAAAQALLKELALDAMTVLRGRR